MSFILVEGTAEKLRSQCPADISHRALEVDVKKLFAKASQVVEEESLQFATASEVEDLQQPRSRRGDSTSSESSRSAESGGSEADEVLKLLKRAGKSKPGKAILSGDIAEDKPKARSRYSLLSSAKEKKEGETLDVDALLLKNLASGSAGPSTLDLNALVQMQILKELRGKGGRKKSKNTITMDDSGSSEDETSSSDEKVRLRGAGKALKAYRQSHKAMKSRPLKHVRRYVKEVEEQLGASSETPYALSDLSRKLNWGKQKSLMRLHFGISEALETLLRRARWSSQPSSWLCSSVPSISAVWTEATGRWHGCWPTWSTRWNAPNSEEKLRIWRSSPAMWEPWGIWKSAANHMPRPTRRPRNGERKEKKGQEDRRRCSRVNASSNPEPTSKHVKTGCSILDLIKKQHGSFSRYFKIYRGFLSRTGDRTPINTHGPITLFPSLLPWTSPPGKSKRRGLMRQHQYEALEWMHQLWALFNFLDSGSPCSTEGAMSSADRAFRGEWTAPSREVR